MKKHFPYLLFLWAMTALSPAIAQTDTLFTFQKVLKDSVASFSVDNLNELYVITTGNRLIKYGVNGDSIGVYNKLTSYGSLSYVEAQNPWKVLLYYKDFSTIVMMDKYLHELGSINLRNKNLYSVEAITTSYDNHIWIYEAQDGKIKKIDHNGSVLMSSTDLRQVFDEVPSPVQLLDHDGLLYLYDPEKGIYIFDYYGGFKRKVPMKGCYQIAAAGKNIYGFTDTTLLKYSNPLPDWESYPLPTALQYSQKVELTTQKLYALKNRGLSVFTWGE